MSALGTGVAPVEFASARAADRRAKPGNECDPVGFDAGAVGPVQADADAVQSRRGFLSPLLDAARVIRQHVRAAAAQPGVELHAGRYSLQQRSADHAGSQSHRQGTGGRGRTVPRSGASAVKSPATPSPPPPALRRLDNPLVCRRIAGLSATSTRRTENQWPPHCLRPLPIPLKNPTIASIDLAGNACAPG